MPNSIYANCGSEKTGRVLQPPPYSQPSPPQPGYQHQLPSAPPHQQPPPPLQPSYAQPQHSPPQGQSQGYGGSPVQQYPPPPQAHFPDPILFRPHPSHLYLIKCILC